MWSIQDVSPEELARLLHHYQGALAHGFDEGEECGVAWERTPQTERKRLVAAARLALLELAAMATQADVERPYFAKPGQAEWGC